FTPTCYCFGNEYSRFWSWVFTVFLKLVLGKVFQAKRQKSSLKTTSFAEREPLREEILDLIEGEKPSILQRKKTGERIFGKILNFVDTFVHGMTVVKLPAELVTA